MFERTETNLPIAWTRNGDRWTATVTVTQKISVERSDMNESSVTAAEDFLRSIFDELVKPHMQAIGEAFEKEMAARLEKKEGEP